MLHPPNIKSSTVSQLSVTPFHPNFFCYKQSFLLLCSNEVSTKTASNKRRRLPVSDESRNRRSHQKSKKTIFKTEAKTFEFRKGIVNAGFVLEIVEKAPYLICTIFNPVKVFSWLKESLFEAMERKSTSQPSWLFGDGTSNLEARIVKNQQGCFLKIAKFLQDRRSILICIPESFHTDGWKSYQDFILQISLARKSSLSRTEGQKPPHIPIIKPMLPTHSTPIPS